MRNLSLTNRLLACNLQHIAFADIAARTQSSQVFEHSLAALAPWVDVIDMEFCAGSCGRASPASTACKPVS
jgi:hypothetical protein